MLAGMAPDRTQFDWKDPLLLDQELTEDERLAREAARRFARDTLSHRVRDDFPPERAGRRILAEVGARGFLGATLPPEAGGAGLGYVAYGLIAREIEYCDSG